MSSSIFEYSTAFKNVSAETKTLCEGSGSNRLKRRDPTMYGEHHKCHQCGEPAKYIAKDTHWCKLCIIWDETPALRGKTMEEIDQIRAGNMAK